MVYDMLDYSRFLYSLRLGGLLMHFCGIGHTYGICMMTAFRVGNTLGIHERLRRYRGLAFNITAK